MKIFKRCQSFCLESLFDGWVIFLLWLIPLALNFWDVTSLDLTKTIFFQMGVVILWLFLVLQFFVSRRRPNLGLSLIPLAIYLIFIVVATIFSLDPATSQWGTYTRQNGLWGNLFYLSWALSLLLSLALSEPELRLKRIMIYLKGAATVSFVVALYAVAQVLGWDLVAWAESPAVTGRALSSLGQPTYLAGFLLLTIPLSFYLVKKVQGGQRWFWLLTAIAQIAGLIVTGTRSALLILILVGAGYLVFVATKQGDKRKVLGAGVVALILILGLFIGWLGVKDQARLSEFKEFHVGSLGLRGELWIEGVAAFKERPWLGYGLDNQAEAYLYQYRSELMQYLRPDIYSDRAHNLLLDILLVGGLVGLILSILFGWSVLNLYPRSKETESHLTQCLAITGLSYILFLTLNFSVIVTSVYAWFLLAIFLSLGLPAPKTKSHHSRFAWLAVILLIPLSFGIIKYSLGRLKADYYHYQALNALNRQTYFTAVILDSYVAETRLDESVRRFYQRKFSLVASEHVLLNNDRLSRIGLLNWMNYLATTEHSSAFEDRFTHALILGLSGDPEKAQQDLNYLKAQTPLMPKLFLASGDIYLANNNFEAALLEFKQAARLIPDLSLESNPDQKQRLADYRQLINNRLVYTQTLLTE